MFNYALASPAVSLINTALMLQLPPWAAAPSQECLGHTSLPGQCQQTSEAY